MNKNIIILVLLILVIAGGVYIITTQKAEAPVMTATLTPTPTASQATATDFKWSFVSKGEDADTGAALTGVTLESGGKTYAAGTYLGSCVVIDGTFWKLLAGESSGVICYFAGGGKELGIFNENGKAVLKIGDVSEGDAETEGTRDNFKTFKVLN